MKTLEIIGFISGIICVYLNIKEKPLGWAFSIVSILCYFFIFCNTKIYADAGLQVFFIIISINGFLNWTAKDKEGKFIAISTSTMQQLMVSIFAICFLFGILIGLLTEYTDSDVPILDAFTTALSIVAQVMLGKKKLENWILWVVADIIYVGLYYHKELYLTAVLYAIFTVLATLGYIEWRKKIITTA